jgi:hypothetical protein
MEKQPTHAAVSARERMDINEIGANPGGERDNF